MKSSTNKLPKHIAIIMDGNGRWAKKRRLPRLGGHRQGVETARNVVKWCSDLKIPYLTLYAFSEENWIRPLTEIGGLMKLLEIYLKKDLRTFMKHNVQVRMIGNLEKLPKSARKIVENTIAATAKNSGTVLTLALSYSGRDEIVRAVHKIIAAKAVRVTADNFGSYLDTADYPDPDLLIRTSGEMRLSNFMLWQLAYTEMVITETLWPDFNETELLNAIAHFQGRERRFGGIGAVEAQA